VVVFNLGRGGVPRGRPVAMAPGAGAACRNSGWTSSLHTAEACVCRRGCGGPLRMHHRDGIMMMMTKSGSGGYKAAMRTNKDPERVPNANLPRAIH
jgi:hypothetical protein